VCDPSLSFMTFPTRRQVRVFILEKLACQAMCLGLLDLLERFYIRNQFNKAS
jgi:hypothetical protein